MKYLIKNNQGGYSLIEVMVAIVILLIALVGPMTIAMKSLQTSYYAEEKATALYLAQEGIEGIIKMRNDALLEAYAAGGGFSTSWNWTMDPGLVDCFASNGCNFDFKGNPQGDVKDDIFDCSNLQDCRLFYTPNDHVPYHLDYNDTFVWEGLLYTRPTPYIRVVRLDKSLDGKEVLITSTVYWDAKFFQGSDLNQVELHSAVFKLYE